MKFRWEKKYLYWGITAFLVIVCSISFFVLLNKIDLVAGAFGVLSHILMPFILGCSFAYLLNPVMDFVEKKWIIPLLKKSKNKKLLKSSRWISITISLLFALAILTGLFIMVIPQFIESVVHIVNNLPTYFTNLEEWVLDLVKNNASLQETLTEQFENLNVMINDWAKLNLLPQINSIISGITTGVLGVLTVVKNIFIGLIISVYVLAAKERFFAQGKKLTYAIFSVKAANVVLKMTRRSDRVFGGFIIGKIIDSAIIGVICFIGMNIFNMPFPLLISVIIGVTNIIPFFGPFIGAIPSGLLILMIDPMSCLYFGIFILALQQFDGNILGPKILGDSTGLSAFWVMFAILVGGGLFGFVGMLVGVPAFAVVYSIISEVSEARLKRHELPSNTDDYYDIDYINPEEDLIYKETVDDVKKA
ncbi:MAG: AI-2E family transporter [Oscillospiraceae bacterium]